MNPSSLQLLLMQSPIWELVNSISIEHMMIFFDNDADSHLLKQHLVHLRTINLMLIHISWTTTVLPSGNLYSIYIPHPLKQHYLIYGYIPFIPWYFNVDSHLLNPKHSGNLYPIPYSTFHIPMIYLIPYDISLSYSSHSIFYDTLW